MSSSSEDEDDAPVAAYRPPDLAQLRQQADDDDDDDSDDEEGQPPAAEAAAAEELGSVSNLYASDPEPVSASPSNKRPRVNAHATLVAEPPQPELDRPPALPPPDLDDVPSLQPPELDEVAASTGGAPKRVRQFEHVDGQFATHIYLPVAAGPSLRRDIDGHTAGLIAPSRARGERAAVHAIAPTDYHVSLSRTCVLLQPQLAAFTEALRVALRPCCAARAATAAVRQLANDSSTRFFAAVELAPQTTGHAAVCRMLDAVDGVCAPVSTRTSRGLRTVRTGYAYQPPACCTYQRHRHCTYGPRVPASGVPYVPRTVLAPQARSAARALSAPF